MRIREIEFSELGGARGQNNSRVYQTRLLFQIAKKVRMVTLTASC